MTRQPIRIEVSAEELAQLEKLRVVRRWDFPACFSTNGRELWPFRTYSLTRPEYRVDVRGTLSLLDEIADWFVHVRPSGGRFFVRDNGAYFKPELLEQFLAFRVVLGSPRRRRPPVPDPPMPPGARDRLEHLDGRCVSTRCRYCDEEHARAAAEKRSRALEKQGDEWLRSSRACNPPRPRACGAGCRSRGPRPRAPAR